MAEPDSFEAIVRDLFRDATHYGLADATMYRRMAAMLDFRCSGDALRCQDGNGCECEMANRVPVQPNAPDGDWRLKGYAYASKQATRCAGCDEYKHTPLRVDWMGGYVCLTCIYKEMEKRDPDDLDEANRADAELFRYIEKYVAAWHSSNAELPRFVFNPRFHDKAGNVCSLIVTGRDGVGSVSLRTALRLISGEAGETTKETTR